jgi:hypothetical protein
MTTNSLVEAGAFATDLHPQVNGNWMVKSLIAPAGSKANLRGRVSQVDLKLLVIE